MNADKPKLLSLQQALDQLLEATAAPVRQEWVPLEQAAERILAQTVVSPMDIPTCNNSAMDGYALRFADVVDGAVFPVAGHCLAGHPWTEPVAEGACLRITTGAMVPDEFDTVIMQEFVERVTTADGEGIRLLERPQAGQHVRLQGSEIEQGQAVLAAGQALGPLQLGVLATLGIHRVCVYPQLKIGVLSTGDELKQPGQALAVGELYDSNRIVIQAVLRRLGYQLVDYGWVQDDPAKLSQVMQQAASEVDALITSGGVSVGDADHTRQVLESLGQINFWQVAIKPGKPFAFGHIGACLLFGLPGNPVSAVMTLEQLVLPALAKRAGWHWPSPPLLQATAQQAFRKKAGRLDFQRVAIQHTEQGFQAEPVGLDSSGMLTSLMQADGWTWLEQARGDVVLGEQITVQLKSPWLS